jgi:hypothetical protein
MLSHHMEVHSDLTLTYFPIGSTLKITEHFLI